MSKNNRKRDAMVNDILLDFDFERVHAIMVLMGVKWYGQEGKDERHTPSVDEIIAVSRETLTEAYDRHKADPEYNGCGRYHLFAEVLHGCFGECVCHDSLCEPGEVRLGYIVNENMWPFPTGIPSIRRYTDPRCFVSTRLWLRRKAQTTDTEPEQSQESVGADSNIVAPAPTLSDPVSPTDNKQPVQLELW